MTKKTAIGYWMLMAAMALIAGAAVLGALAPALIAEGLMAKGLAAWLVAGGATGAVVLAPIGLALVE